MEGELNSRMQHLKERRFIKQRSFTNLIDIKVQAQMLGHRLDQEDLLAAKPDP